MYTGSIRRMITIYKAHFDELNGKGRAKWGSVQTFQDFWDIEAADFGAMLKKALPRRSSRLASDASCPSIDQMHRLATFRPEGVRRLFRLLFQDNLDFRTVRFAETLDMFKKAALRLHGEYKPEGACTQNELAAMYYLTLRYPDRFAFFSPSAFDRLYRAANIRFYQPKGISDLGKLQLYLRLVDLIRFEIARDRELVDLARQSIGPHEYPDPDHWLLAQDLVASLKSEWFAPVFNEPVMIRPRSLLVPKPPEQHELRSGTGVESEEERIYLDAAILLIRELEQQQVNRFCTHFDVMPDGMFKGREIGYSIRSLDRDMKPLYILVKATARGHSHPVKLLPEEITFSEEHADRFRLYHVYHFDPFGKIMTANITKYDGPLVPDAKKRKAASL